MGLNSKKLIRLPKKNAEEAGRIIGNLKIHLEEIKKTADVFYLEEVNKKIKRLSKRK